MIAKQKNYVHAWIDDIPQDQKNSYVNTIVKHHLYLHNLIYSTGNEHTAENMQKKLTEIKKMRFEIGKDKLTLDQKIMKVLKKTNNKKLYDSFLDAILDDFSKISVDRKNLLTKDLKINPDAIHSVRVNFREVQHSDNYHILKTIANRCYKAMLAVDDEITKKDTQKDILQLLSEIGKIIEAYTYKVLKKGITLEEMIKVGKKIENKEELSDQEDGEYKTKIVNKDFDQYDTLEKLLGKLYELVRSANIIKNLEARVREIIVTMMSEIGDEISDEAIEKTIEIAINRASVANAKVGFSFDEKVTGKLLGKEAKKYTKNHYTHKIGDNDFYIDFGADLVKNKIDGYITIHDEDTNMSPKQVGISIKSYSILYGKTNKVTLAETLNLLSLILGMNSIEKSYAFLNTIAPKRKDKTEVAKEAQENNLREYALDILKRQAIYAAATGHLGGRQLLNNTDKAEYLVIEDKTSPNVFVYAMSTIIKNADKYISINPNPFKLNTYEEYFENNYITGGKDPLAAMRRNTLLLIKLRQTKLDIGVKKSELKNAAALKDNNLVPY